jgi:uncharacterized protein (TIGR02246 family)
MSSDLRKEAVEARSGEHAVRALFDETSRAWTDGDAEGFAGRYAEDATVILPGVHLRGSADIRTGMGEAFAGPLKNTRRVHTPQSIRFLGADVAVVVTRSVTVLPGQTDPPEQQWELATWTLARRDDTWLVEAYHSCPAS